MFCGLTLPRLILVIYKPLNSLHSLRQIQPQGHWNYNIVPSFISKVEFETQNEKDERPRGN